MAHSDTTSERVRALRENDPHITAAEIARRLHVSRERVRQLLVQLGLPTVTRRSFLGPPKAPRAEHRSVPRVQTGGVPVEINATTAGHIAELLAAADLAARGHAVFLPIIRTERCDLIAMNRTTGELERIEVRSGSRHSDGRVVWRRGDKSRSDRRAIVLVGEPVQYEPPFPAICPSPQPE